MSGVFQIIRKNQVFKNLPIFLLTVISVSLNAQTDKKFIRKGNREYEDKKYSESEISYRKAIDKNNESADAIFNVGDALYKQNKFEEAGKQFIENTNQSADKLKKSEGFYNLGNSMLQAKKFPESIDAYKNSLKLNPGNKEAKYNLAYAQDQLKKQQEQQQKQQQQQNKNNQDKKKEDKNKDQNNKDQNNQQDKQKDQNEDQKKDQQQPQKQQISKDDAQRLLNSLANDEKNVQEKVKLAKAAKSRVRAAKNW